MSGLTPAQNAAARWQEGFCAAMEAMGDCRPEIEPLASAPEPPPDLLWWKQPFDVSPGAIIWVAAAEAAWSAMGSAILAAAGIDSGSQDELKSTYLETLRQGFGALAQALGEKAGRDVSCVDGAEEEPPAGDAPMWVSISLNGAALPPMCVRLSAELLLAFEEKAAPEARPDAPHQAHEQQQQQQEEQQQQTPEIAISSHALGTLNLLMDVELPVSVSFGRAHLRVREALKLITGSIIELDRAISEPVEVIVNNCVIARGEVVVVDGYYGVRINEVMSRNDRLRESRRHLLPAAAAHRR